MSIFFWKNNNIIDMFASELANELYGKIHPSEAKKYFEGFSDKKEKKDISNKMQREIQSAVKNIIQFKLVNKLGVYGKARLHLKFKARLEELGFEKDVVKQINEIVMLNTP